MGDHDEADGVERRYTAFIGDTQLARGAPGDVLVAVKDRLAQDGAASILVFDDATGRSVDVDLRGSDEEIRARVDPAAAPRGPGRPKLGVVAREVTLLPRHWDWLGLQRGGASVALRRLVDEARSRTAGATAIRQAQEAADRFMSVTAGDRSGYEEASRALYARDGERFDALAAAWPDDIRVHARRLAGPAFQAGET